MGFEGFEERAQFSSELSTFAPWGSAGYNEEHLLKNKPILAALAAGSTTYASAPESDRHSVYSDDTASIADSVFDNASIASSQSSYGSAGSDSSEDSSDGETLPTSRTRQTSTSKDAHKKLEAHPELLSGLGAESLPLRFSLDSRTDTDYNTQQSDKAGVAPPHPTHGREPQSQLQSQQQTTFKQPPSAPAKGNRRRSISSESAAPPCRLKRDTESTDCFVMMLISKCQRSDSPSPSRLTYISAFASRLITAIWPLSACPPMMSSCFNGAGVLPLEVFIHETLRRSKTSYSTLQVALWYLMLLKCQLPKSDFTKEQGQSTCRAMQCGRRMFLAALMLASKYLQDRNYSTRAWSKISGLRICEINENEMKYLEAIDYRLHIAKDTFDNWSRIVLTLSKLAKLKPGCPAVQSQLHPFGSAGMSSLGDMVDFDHIPSDDNAFFSDKWWCGVLAKLDPAVCDSEENSKQFLRQSLPSVDLSHPMLRLEQGVAATFDGPADRTQSAFSSPALSTLQSGSSTPVHHQDGQTQPTTALPLRPQLRNLPTPASTPRGVEGCLPMPSQMNLRCSASADALRSVRRQCFANANLERCPPPRPQAHFAPPHSRMRPAASIPYQQLPSPPTSSPLASDGSDASTGGRSRSSSISSNSSWSSRSARQPISGPFNLDKILNQPQEPSPLTRVVSMPETRVPTARSSKNHSLRRMPQFSDIAAARSQAAAARPGVVNGARRDHLQEADAADALLRLCAGRLETQQQMLLAAQQVSPQYDISPRGHKRHLSHSTEALQDNVRELLQQQSDGDEVMSDNAMKIHQPSSPLEKKWQMPARNWALPKKPVTTLYHKRMALYCTPSGQLSAPELTAMKLKEQLLTA